MPDFSSDWYLSFVSSINTKIPYGILLCIQGFPVIGRNCRDIKSRYPDDR